MAKITMKPQNLPEKLVWYYLLCTYPIYFLGAQAILAPLLVTFLVLYLLLQWRNQTEETSQAEKINISASAWVWIIAVLVIELALIVGQLNSGFGIIDIFKSSITWYRTWAMFALFPLAGHLNIRPQLIYRATCLLCLQSLVLIIIGTLADFIGIINIVYNSPLFALARVFGDVPIQYDVQIFHSIKNRLILFAIWPTFLAALVSFYFCFALREPNKKLRFISMFTAILMLVATQGRTAIVGLPLVLALVWFITNCLRPRVQIATAIVTFFAGIFAPTLIDSITSFKEQFDQFRPGSSEVRSVIYSMTLERWWNDAPIWGFGIKDQAPAIVHHLPLGSHHTWFGILFTHGLVGCVALGVACLWSFINLSIKAQNSDVAKVGLSVLLIIFICSLADNLDFFSYLLCPGLIILGIAFKENSTQVNAKRISQSCLNSTIY